MLRVWTKLYNAFNTGQISFLGRATRGCGGAEQQKDRNSITLSPLFTSPPPSLLSHLLSFPHVCLLSISPLLYLLPPFLKSLCTSSPHHPHLFPSPILFHFLPLVSSLIHPCPLLPYIPLSPFLFGPPPASPCRCLCSPIYKATCIFRILSKSLTGNIETPIVQRTKVHS